jgi:hypothetical protein
VTNQLLDGGGPDRLLTRQEAPTHGKWNDMSYLMSTFTDNYEMYLRRCGKGAAFDSIWECYTPTAQANIMKHLTKSNAYMESLTNSELTTLLCKSMGLSYTKETETALKEHKLDGSHLKRENWVTLQTQWERVLERTAPKGNLLPKAIASIFIEAITFGTGSRSKKQNRGHKHSPPSPTPLKILTGL